MWIKTALKDLMASFVARAVPRGLFCDKRYFSLWQSQGYHITPVHFYQPIPDTRTLKEELWTVPSEMPGICMRVNDQLCLLNEFSRKYKSEYDNRDPINKNTPDWEVLYCMVRHFQPRRVIEIGSGVSTRVSAMALERNREELHIEATLTAIEPYPKPELLEGFPGLTKLVKTPVQEVPLALFRELEENDILFIDSSHVVKAGSDVQHEFLEILPRLKKGVLIHVHDVFFPFDYQREWLMDRAIFWNEQYLLQAFLAFNSAFEVLFSNSYLHFSNSSALKEAFDGYNPSVHQPGSFWMRRVA